jgi:hypothetical protein
VRAALGTGGYRESRRLTAVKGFADLANLPEDDRIAIIGTYAAEGRIIGFIVEDDEKADRYLTKLVARHRVRLVGRSPGPVAGSILVRIGPAES